MSGYLLALVPAIPLVILPPGYIESEFVKFKIINFPVYFEFNEYDFCSLKEGVVLS